MFLIKSFWTNAVESGDHFSLGIQYDASGASGGEWTLTSAPIAVVPLTHFLAGHRAHEPVTSRPDGDPDPSKLVYGLQLEHPVKCQTFTVPSTGNVRDLLKSTFLMALTGEADPLNRDLFFHSDMKLYTVQPSGQLVRVYCNFYTDVRTLDEWTRAANLMLDTIKCLSPTSGAGDHRPTKRQK